MDKMEQAKAYFAAMPKRHRENPFWVSDLETGQVVNRQTKQCFTPSQVEDALTIVRDYFRAVFDSFGTEAQVLLVNPLDAARLKGIPTLGNVRFHGLETMILVLPQWNTQGNSMISESMYYKWIREPQVTPIARIHSHHRLDAYQSATDYNTLNSGTLELVLGHITEEDFQVAYWLDTPGERTKDIVWQATGNGSGNYSIRRIKSGCFNTTEDNE